MNALGKWPNAPLAYVVTEIRFGRILSLESFASTLQELISGSFPRLLPGHAFRLAFTSQGVTQDMQPRFTFVSTDSRQCVVLQDETLSVHVTQYRDFEAFAETLGVVWDAWARTRPNTFVERLGLRYWDVVADELGLSCGQFFADPFASMSTLWPHHRLSRGAHELSFEIADPFPHQVQGRISVAPPSVQPLPANFAPAPEILLPERVLSLINKGAATQASVGHIDIDASADIKELFHTQRLIDAATALHDAESSLFKVITSVTGQAAWKGGK